MRLDKWGALHACFMSPSFFQEDNRGLKKLKVNLRRYREKIAEVTKN